MKNLKTVDIKGKAYVTVNERIRYFREKYPEYSLITDLIEVNANHALIKASVIDKDGRILANGTSFETAGTSFINKFSHVENAETSAWGRALGNFGIGIDESVASFEEVATAIQNQTKPPKEIVLASHELMQEICKLTNDMGGSMADIYTTYKFTGTPPEALAQKILKTLKDKKEKLSSDLDSH